MELLILFLVFCYTGLFTIGGGMAAIPLIQDVCVSRGWLTVEQFYQMVAISEATPGPIGINVATFVGYTQQGILGGIVATLGAITPPFIIVMLVIKIIKKYSQTAFVKAMFIGLRATIIGLIATASYSLLKITLVDFSAYSSLDSLISIFNIKAILIFTFIAFTYFKFKKHPLIYIAMGAVAGMLFL